MKVITFEDKKQINELYLKYKTYAAVSRITGFSPGTVKKYVRSDYTPRTEIKSFEGDLPDFNPQMFRIDDWGPLCVLSDEEIQEIKELWKELEL